MTITTDVIVATGLLLSRIEALQSALEGAEESFVAEVGLRMPAEFAEDVSEPYQPPFGAAPHEAVPLKVIADAVMQAEYALSEVAPACLQVLPIDYRRRRLIWSRSRVGFLQPPGEDAGDGDVLRQAWEG